MKASNKKNIKNILSALVVFNTALFLVLAYFHQLSTDSSRAAVFVDFWGRYTVYSLWFIGFAVYVKYLDKFKTIKLILLTAVCLNIPLFLLLAYFDKISNTPETLIFIDFWGRITVYSLWFICYEAYRKYIGDIN